jgi:hypothetical protein
VMQAWSGRSRFAACVVGAVLLAAVSAGCGSQSDMAPVDGVVRLDGAPLTKGIVTFVPDAGRSASGPIGSDGTFQLSTLGKSDGALVGKHRITITATNVPTGPPNFDLDRPNASPVQGGVPARYASAEASELTFEVKAGESNHAELELTSK